MIALAMESTYLTGSRDRLRAGPDGPSLTVRGWTREVAHLRARVVKLKPERGGAGSAVRDTIEDALALCGHLLQELAGAYLQIEAQTAEMRAEREHADYMFDRMPLACVCADESGRITRANRAAALLLNVSVRHLVRKPLLYFTHDRDSFVELLHRLRRDGTQLQCTLTLRPREHATIQARVTAVPQTSQETREWWWFLAPDANDTDPSAQTLGLHVASPREPDRGMTSSTAGAGSSKSWARA
jgi:PAS domain-containing protein